MITLATITKINRVGKLEITVRVPIFDSPGVTEYSNISCSLCQSPAEIDGYNVGDVVYVGFEDNRIDRPIILGKLRTDLNATPSSTSTLSTNSLVVSDKAYLPADTTVGGISLLAFKSAINNTKYLGDYVEQLKKIKEEGNVIQIIDLR